MHPPQRSVNTSTLELGSQPEYPKHKEIRKLFDDQINARKDLKKAPIIGITGTGGAGKSSLIDEVILRFLNAFPKKKIAILSVHPTRVKTGGALLGDRIRMNTADNDRVYVRSMATRNANISISKTAKITLDYLALANFDLVLFETAGIGQSDESVKDLCDFSVYVMTPEFGAPSQLEKIGMLDVASIVVVNKFDKPGSLDALRDVQKTFLRNHQYFDKTPSSMPVYGTSAHIFGDLGTNRFFNRLMEEVSLYAADKAEFLFNKLPEGDPYTFPIIPRKRVRYLSEVADSVREHHRHIDEQAELFDRIDAITTTMSLLNKDDNHDAIFALTQVKNELSHQVDENLSCNVDDLLHEMDDLTKPQTTYEVRGKEINVDNYHISLSHIPIPKVKVPNLKNRAALVKFVGLENLPGHFPYTAGVFPFKRTNERSYTYVRG